MVMRVMDQNVSCPLMSLRPTNSCPLQKTNGVCNKRDTIQKSFRSHDDLRDCCRICTRVIYLPSDGMPIGNRDRSWCLPCNCSQPVHHGCIAAHIRNQSRCKQCNYKYKYFRYGTWFDFIRRYPCRTTVPVLIYLLTLIVAAWAIYNWRISDNSLAMSQLSLLFSAAALVFLSTLILLCWILYLVGVRKEQFVRRHAQITVFDHITSANRRNEERIRQLRAGAFLLNHSISGLSSIYQQRVDQASITGMAAFDHDRWLASSTPLLDYTKRSFEFGINGEMPKETDVNQNLRSVYPSAKISSMIVVHECDKDASISTEPTSQSPQWSKSTALSDNGNVMDIEAQK